MPSDSQITLKALGLKTSPNELGTEPGAMKKASNVNISRDGIVEPRRGFKLYGTDFGSISDRAKQLMEYKNRLLRHFSSTLQYDTEESNVDGDSVFNSFSTPVNSVEDGLRIKSLEANGNLYFTTDEGIKKLSISDFDDTNQLTIDNAGGIKALDIETRLNVTIGNTTGFFPLDSVMAYRTLWLKTDNTENTGKGTPSARSVIYNPLLDMLIRDFAQVLAALDSLNTPGSKITDGNYVSTLALPITSSAVSLHTNMVDLCEKIDQDQGTIFSTAQIVSASVGTNICTVTVNDNIALRGKIAVGDPIYLQGTWNTSAGLSIAGLRIVRSVDEDITPTTFTFSVTAADGVCTLANTSIEHAWFRNLEAPDVPNIPATHDELQSLFDYLDSIIIELQSVRNIREVADNDGTVSVFPVEISTGSVSTGTTLTVTCSASCDFQDVFLVGDYAVLAGTWTSTSPSTNLATTNTYVTIASVTNTSITATIVSSTNGAVTLDTSSKLYRVQRYTDTLKSLYIDTLDLTTSATVDIDIPIPTDVDETYFFQIYRSDITTAATTDILADLLPNDEMRLVYEAYPTAAELAAGTITVEDISPESFFTGGEFLYTNEANGEGILQANDIPPLAKDINTFKGYTFYANTRTRQRKNLTLLGVSDILTDYNNGASPSFSIITEDSANEYRFVKGVQQVVTLTSGSAGNITAPAYFNINTGNNETAYSVWFASNSASVNPTPAGRTGIRVDVSNVSTADEVGQKIRDMLAIYVDDFIISGTASSVVITNTTEGPATAPSIVSGLASPFALTLTTAGAGENLTKEVTSITCIAGNLFASSGAADYFTLNTPFDRERYAFWFNVTGGSMTAPVLNTRTSSGVTVLTTDSSTDVATKLATALNLIDGFSASSNSSTVTVSTTSYGPTVDATEVVTNVGFSLSVTQQGALDVLLSNLVSPSLAVEETTTSLNRAININSDEVVNAFYLSGINTVPGIFLLEAKSLGQDEFYVVTNAADTGNSFNPTLVPSFTSLSNSAANPSVVTLASHGLATGDQVLITHSNSYPKINGLHSVTVINANTFSVEISVAVAGTTGVLIPVEDAQTSTNEEKLNRIYYSKLQTPEAVPILNYFDVGAANKQILRIYPLRDTLFVFKEDGLYRVSGETAPFTIALFDSSYIVVVPDSIGVVKNVIYAWTTQGIKTVSENGSPDKPVSRDIDNLILRLNTPQYPDFQMATWGLGYESDNSYLIFTVDQTTDEVATIAYRYSTLTMSWTVYDISHTCGIVKSSDDLLYLGAGDVNSLEVERKTFSRTDHADREVDKSLLFNNLVEMDEAQYMVFDVTSDIDAGDVIVQEQYVSLYDYHKLLNKLDIDPTVAPAYTVSSASWNSSVATFNLSASVSSFLAVGDYVVVQDMNPVGFNGTHQITAISSSSSVQVAITDNPGAFLGGGSLKYSYFHSLELSNGSNMRTALTTLASKLDIDPGVTDTDYSTEIADLSGTGSFSVADPTVVTDAAHGLLTGRYINVANSNTTPNIDERYSVTVLSASTFTIPIEVTGTGTAEWETLINNFNDIQACYNLLTAKLNLDTGVGFSNYPTLSGTKFMEDVVTSVDNATRRVNMNKVLQWIAGSMTVFKAISSEVEYLPVSMENPLSLKHFREAQLLLLNKTFSNGIMRFASDLNPSFVDVTITGFGSGIFGNDAFGENYFGGDSHSPPFRTYVPRTRQRARFLRIGHSHSVAREKYSILGITVTGRVVSTRSYR